MNNRLGLTLPGPRRADDGADHLTPDITKIKATGNYHDQSRVRKLKVQPQVTTGSFQVTDPAGHRIPFAPGDYLVLKLEDVPVAAAAGLAVLRVTEAASRTQNASPSTAVAAVPLVKTAKQAPAPSNFHPDKAMVDDGDKIVLRWDGPGDLDYKIRSSDGNPAPGVTTKGEWKPDPGTGPKRDTTYTLIATDPNTGRQHFLTTTVQLRNPTFESGIHASRVQGTANTGGLTFTTDGVHVSANSGAWGAVHADKVEAGQVTAAKIHGGRPNAGALLFTTSGVEVVSNAPGGQGILLADRVNAGRVQGKSTNDGWISFPGAGIQVSSGTYLDTPKNGCVFAEVGIFQNQSFSGGKENRWIAMSDGAEVCVIHMHEDGTRSYGDMKVSSVKNDFARW
ncbi:hypothetical protein [Actinoallomurus sp. CA-150999]|uniref:hypothetical protein n=1 Tax=Actinoallomurus sp. CA-150999 TaxID=3239887 RepID=UPI003D92A4A7